MHDTAMMLGRAALEIYGPRRNGAILEIGSYDFNGSLRSAARPDILYTGVDTSPGPNVDIVVDPGQPLPVEDEGFDLVIASSVLEHDPMFWMTFLEMVRKTRKGGYIYINSPSNGAFHRYPQDNWRFYPDSGHALLNWAKSQNLEVNLVESFIAERKEDIWNDFVAVFRRGPSRKKFPDRLLYTEVNATNVRRGATDEIINFRDCTQDMELLESAKTERKKLEHDLRSLTVESAEHIRELRDHEAQFAAAKARETESAAKVIELSLALTDANQALDRKDDAVAERSKTAQAAQERIAALESELRQRQEETVQAAAELSRLRQLIDQLEAEIAAAHRDLGSLREQLAEANDWVFRIAGDRRLAEANSAAARTESERLRRQLIDQAASVEALHADVERLQTESAGRQSDLEHALSVARLAREDQDAANARADAAAARLTELDLLLATEHGNAQRQIENLEGARQTAEERLAREQAHFEIRITERFAESAVLTNLLRDHEEGSEREQAKLEWIRKFYAAQESSRWWWSLLGRDWQQKRLRRRLKARGLFDADGYLARYPDVLAEGMDPVRHFLLHGIHEGRSPAI